MTVALFPGQGSQFRGMGHELFDQFPALEATADAVLGYSIRELCVEDPRGQLDFTLYTQPALYVVNAMTHLARMAAGAASPQYAAGHSLGEYAALVAAGVLSFQDAVLLVHKRGAYMQEAVPVGEGAMAAVIGLDDDTIIAVCAEASAAGAVQAVNFNCPGQTVIAGTAKGVETAVQLLQEKGAKKAVILPVSAPFHSTLMAPAAKKLAAELDKVTLHDAAFPVVSNYTGSLQRTAAEIKANLVAQADHPVRWIACVNTMREFGADTYVECGPGKTLAGFNKRIDKALKSLNVENVESLQKTLDTLKK